MSGRFILFTAALAVGAFAVIGGCSKSSSPTSGGVGGGSKEFVSPTLNPNDSFQHVFTKAATYHYFCSFHGTATTGMHAMITVTAGGTPSLHQDDIVTTSLQDFNIVIGDTIRWTNKTTMQHNVQSAE